nr:hypothetical protein [Tanacetum cinerariifolium]
MALDTNCRISNNIKVRERGVVLERESGWMNTLERESTEATTLLRMLLLAEGYILEDAEQLRRSNNI